MVYYVVRVCQSTHCNVQFMHVYACGPKTVLVNRTFLKNAISEVRLGWGGVGGMSTFLVLRTL